MKTKKQMAILLTLALIITTVPNIFDATIAVAKEAWKILSEKDLVIDEVYNINDDIMIGRKDGKISFLDKNLQLINQTEYDQIEDSLHSEWLVSRLVDEKSEFAILDQTGEVKKVLGIYDMLSKLSKPYNMIENANFLFATKENGQHGFLTDEKEFGFDDVFAGKEGIVRAEILTVGEKNYYVKEYFENEEVSEDIGIVFWNYDGISVKEFQEILALENCEFAFYDEEGTVISSNTIAESIKTQEEQVKIQEQVDEKKKKEIEEKAKQLPIAEYSTATWEDYNDFKIKSTSVSKFGEAYLVYICTKIYYKDYYDDWSETMYFAGVYDLDGNLQRFGELLAADEAYVVEYEYEGIVLREIDKKIYFYHLGREKYIYTDKKNEYSSFMYDENQVYEDEVILWGDYKANVLVTNPQSGFLKEAEQYFYLSKDIVRKVLLMETSDAKELVIYDYQWNEIKKIDLSYLADDFRYRKYDDGIAVYDKEEYVYIDVYGNDYKVLLSDYPEFADVEDIYTVKGRVYAYIESEKGHMLYQLGNMDKMKLADNIEISMLNIIEGQAFWQYRITVGDNQRYYGLMDFKGNLVVDAMEMGYIEGYTRIKDENNMCACFEDEEGNEFYYYEKTLMAHSDDDDWDVSDWDVSDSGTRYDDIVYYSNSLYDEEKEEWIGREEKVYDNDGNLLVGHIVPEELLENSGWKEFIYIYKTSRIILAINKYWDGKRGGDWSTIEPLATLTPAPIPTDRPIKTAAPSGTKPEKTAAPSGAKPEKTVAPIGIEPEETVVPSSIKPEETIAPGDMEPEETVAPNNIGRGKIKKVKNLKGKKVKLSLKKIENAKGYQIAYATNKKFRKKKLLTSKKMTVTVRKLKKKKTYYFKVRAYYSVNGKRKYGKWSNVKKIKIRR